MKIYLSGPIAGCTDSECKFWRNAFKRSDLPCEFHDPMDRDMRGKTLEESLCVVEADKEQMRDSDIILVNFQKASVGTSMEIIYAYEVLKKPIILMNTSRIPRDNLSPWLVYHSSYYLEGPEQECIGETYHYLMSILEGRKVWSISHRTFI